MEDKMLDVEGRVKRYWYSDGIGEISIGLVFIILGAFFGVQGYFGEGSKISVILQMSMIVVMMGSIFGSQWLVNTMKSRLTYPRTGYVEYHAKDKGFTQHRLIVVGVAFVVAVASFVLLSFFVGEVDLLVLVSSILVGAIFIVLRGRSSGVVRFYYFGGLSFILGVVLSFTSLSRLYNLSLFYGLMGLVMLISGILVLRHYLRENPMLTEGDNE